MITATAILSVMRILWCIPSFPFDPTGGGNRSLRTMCEMLASEGHTVRCVGTFGSGNTFRQSPFDILQSIGVEHYKRYKESARLSLFYFRNVRYEIHEDLDAMVDHELANRPDIMLTYGGNPQDFDRMKRAKAAGAKIVFGLRNGLYKDKNHFRLCDGIITPSQWMTDWYKRTMGLESTPLPLPINTEDCVWPDDTPKDGSTKPRAYVTMVNPSHEKGEQITRAIAAALPTVPFQIVLSRTKPTGQWSENCAFIGPVANPRDIYRYTKILLVPSLWEEPGGRVVCEAMLNGIPPIVSDHGALPEVVNNGGFVVPTARKLFDHSPVTADEIAPWIEAIDNRCNHENFYRLMAEKTRAAGQRYDSKALTAQYCHFFESVMYGDSVPPPSPESALEQQAIANKRAS